MDSIPAILLFQSLEHFIRPAVKPTYPFLSRQVGGGGSLFKPLLPPSNRYCKKARLSIRRSIRAGEVEGFLLPFSFVAVATVYRGAPLPSACLRRREGSLLKLLLLPSCQLEGKAWVSIHRSIRTEKIVAILSFQSHLATRGEGGEGIDVRDSS